MRQSVPLPVGVYIVVVGWALYVVSLVIPAIQRGTDTLLGVEVLGHGLILSPFAVIMAAEAVVRLEIFMLLSLLFHLGLLIANVFIPLSAFALYRLDCGRWLNYWRWMLATAALAVASLLVPLWGLQYGFISPQLRVGHYFWVAAFVLTAFGMWLTTYAVLGSRERE